MDAFLERARSSVNGVLARWAEWARAALGGAVGEAVAYSLAGPGKRFRPALTMAVFRELGGDDGAVAELAAAVEVVHTYSLVHDDLPCMDDDDLRRGRPTTHRQFGVAVAVEAGYRMVPLAGRVLAAGAGRMGLPPDVAGSIGVELYGAAGARGMVGGQLLDLEAEGRRLSGDGLLRIHGMKTGALITASAVVGALAAQAPAPAVEAIRRYGREIGVAFQIADDILDATGTSQELGKTAGKDARQHKATFATILGIPTATAEANRRVEIAMDQLGRAGIDSKLLNQLALFIINRRS